MRAPRPVPLAVFVALAAACVLFGTAVRVADGYGKIFYQDEAVTSVRASGYLLADESALFDGKTHDFASLQRLLHPAPSRGLGATLRSLAIEDPQHPPAFYLMEAVWMRAFGGTPIAVRSLAILCGLLALPLAYALALELFASARVACLCVAFFAISPFFVLYGYQAREYGLFATVTLLSTLLFARACRRRGAADWGAYALSIALGTYVYLFFAFVLAAHAIAAVVRAASARRDAGRILVPFAASGVAGLVLAAPWLAVVFANARSATSDVGWATTPYPLPFMVAKWLFFTAATFFDVEYLRASLAIVALLVLVATAYAIVAFARDRTTRGDVKALLFALGGTTFACLALADLVLHHRFSTIGRYLTPTWIALVFIVAAALGERVRERIPAALLTLLVASAIVSDIASARSDSWWENSGNKSAPALAAYLAAHPGPLVVGEGDAAPLLVLAALVPPGATWLGYRANAVPRVVAPNAYLLSPSEDVRRAVERRTHARARVVYDSHDFSSNLTRVRGATVGERAGANDWGELVLYRLDASAPTP